MKIIAFSGKKQSGKTTAVRFLRRQIERNYSDTYIVMVLCFAGYLKEMCARCFKVYLPFYETDEAKSTRLACGKTVRELLQYMGTDVFRAIDSDCWVNAYQYAAYGADIILTPDVRFPNEVKCIQDMGGRVIRLLRAPFREDKHESETALDELQAQTMAVLHSQETIIPSCDLVFDAIIDNRNMTIEEQNEAAWKVVTEKDWV